MQPHGSKNINLWNLCSEPLQSKLRRQNSNKNYTFNTKGKPVAYYPVMKQSFSFPLNKLTILLQVNQKKLLRVMHKVSEGASMPYLVHHNWYLDTFITDLRNIVKILNH